MSSPFTSSERHIGTIVAFFDVGVDCTFMSQSLKIITKGLPYCIPLSCVSDWESTKGQLTDVEKEVVEKETENIYSELLAAEGIDSGDGECKMNDWSVVAGSSAGKASGMLAIAATATSAAAALFFF